MKILITGSTGRLGGALARVYAGRHEVVALDRSQLDLSDVAGICATLGAMDYDVLVNPAALTNVDHCEQDEAEAVAVNAVAPGVLAEVSAAKGARLIHISTDYVFDGEAEGRRTETDPTNPRSVYGKSKLAGEEAVLEAGEGLGFLVVRTSWIFGPDRPSFADAIVERALREDRVEAIEDKDSSPTYSLDFAEWLEPLLGDRSRAGIVHLCNEGSCSWREYGQAALDAAWGAGLPLRARTVEGIPLSAMEQFVAPRPIHSGMATGKYSAWTGKKPRRWREALGEYMREFVVPRYAKNAE